MAVDSEPTSPTGGGSIIPKPTNKEMPSGQNDGRHGSLKRDLSPRDLNMIAIAGSVGTGLIIGIGASLTIGGPAPLLLSFILVGSVVWFVITALGEMATMVPMKKGFAGYATKFVDPALGFATGWNYFFKYVMLLPTNLTASGLILQYWLPNLNTAVWVTVFGAVLLALNLLQVSVYGKAQFYFGVVKLAVLFAMLVACIVFSAGGGPNHESTGFRHWKHEPWREYIADGPVGRLLAFWVCMINTCFAYTGAEVVGASFGEVSEPRKSIPRAVRLTALRIISIYVGTTFILTLAVSPDSKLLTAAVRSGVTSGAASPFIVSTIEAGVRFLPDIFNFCLLFFVISAANADIYTASRTLHGLAVDSQAPHWFGRTTRKGVPIPAVCLSSVFILVAYMNAKASTAQVFSYLVRITTVFGALNWVNILLAYIGFTRALKAQGFTRRDLPYAGPFQPYGAYWALGLTAIMIALNGWEAFVPRFDAKTFVLAYLGVLIWVLDIAGWKVLQRTRLVRPKTVSLRANDGDDEEPFGGVLETTRV